MYELLIRQLEEYANEYEIGTPTGDTFKEAAEVIARLSTQLNAVTDRLESILTNKESDTEIYYRLQHKWDTQYISGNLIDWLDDEEYDDIFNRLENDPDFCSRVAFKYREYLDDCITGENEFDCLLDACKYIMKSDDASKEGA